ncbi:MAG: hypothetical protein H0U28_01310, partial [Nocardioidaceae bacterium]|nr:hypothetical protein [Nocardioidaceae bacterium]
MAPLRKLAAVRVAAPFAALALATLGPAALALAGPSVTASAVESVSTQLTPPGYTYWGFYIWKDAQSTWAYSPVGANDTKDLPDDGDVYGFRWALVVKGDTRLPRADGDFEAICGDVRNDEGEKRIAFVIDYGAETDAVADDVTP